MMYYKDSVLSMSIKVVEQKLNDVYQIMMRQDITDSIINDFAVIQGRLVMLNTKLQARHEKGGKGV